MEPWFTDHALKRARERGIELQQVYFVVHQGARYMQPNGTIKRVLLLANLHKSELQAYAELIGLTVVLDASEQTVITMYHDLKLM